MLQFDIRLHNYDSWEITKNAALLAEKLGFDSLWLNNHVIPPSGPTSKPFRGAWSSLAALAAPTKRLKVGTPVTCNGFRAPALLAKLAGHQIYSVRATHYGGGSSIERSDRKTLLRTIRGYALGIRLAQIDT